MSAAPTPRPELASLPEYRAGKPAPAVPGLAPLKLSSNERSDGLSPAARAALVESVAFNRYPDPATTELRNALAAATGVPAAQIITESGSLGALRLILDAVVPRDGERAEVVFPWRSFEAYPIIVEVAGARGRPIPLSTGGANDLDAMADAIGPGTCAVILCTPNNPTGAVITRDAFDAFMARVPEHVLVVLDEAYLEYVDDPDALDGLDAFARYPNVALTRTFSKAYGLAGLRIGYAILSPELADALWRIRPTFAVTAIAEQAALSVLADADGLAAHVTEVQRGRRVIADALRAAGEEPIESQANFVWFEPRDPDAVETAAACHAVSLRRLGDGIRITIGDAAATERVLAVIGEL
ncbi:aminotransferase class I/II-fold pyridoxal phosphate-dependent enzyme [Microbacterium gorillae]|uniref:aminotransferase class I/II-fold pyridoxal phosphate-dependent enzyme n=1 Tax=Microbacterium gorillae TaxID=1231063 RepID=UPI00058C588D|nr:aminotransferase class I/II-fold pyridoxal phosphate-dependent enzyme [Microbacterium gorillae]